MASVSYLLCHLCSFVIPNPQALWLLSISPSSVVMPKFMIVTFHSPLYPGLSPPLLFSIFPFMIRIPVCQLLPTPCPPTPTPALLSYHLQSVFCLSCTEITFVKVTNLLLISTPDRHISALLLFQLPGTFGMIFSLFAEEASTAGCLPASFSLSLRPLCQLLTLWTD